MYKKGWFNLELGIDLSTLSATQSIHAQAIEFGVVARRSFIHMRACVTIARETGAYKLIVLLSIANLVH